ncbi:MAG: hydrogenase maturation nickel metallochaperone HypA [Methanomicrobiales archaeon]|nr:hydrogenase maturation nickel metallochaperone HypA [Methanomicrobiales archaeon]
MSQFHIGEVPILPHRKVFLMCSAGGPFEVTILDTGEREYRCNRCGKEFSDATENPSCPECGSEDLSSA